MSTPIKPSAALLERIKSARQAGAAGVAEAQRRFGKR